MYLDFDDTRLIRILKYPISNFVLEIFFVSISIVDWPETLLDFLIRVAHHRCYQSCSQSCSSEKPSDLGTRVGIRGRHQSFNKRASSDLLILSRIRRYIPTAVKLTGNTLTARSHSTETWYCTRIKCSINAVRTKRYLKVMIDHAGILSPPK
ncbi:unnamed protein product [Cuscuta europaea]|uniref:Uncharacterized protein n=1 Tax=Cuscuta europaea TaxID=41803 RepID=A0A9P0YGJ2_CUSEU|nr:unnamed protein product [Cuscuta europaea]